MWCLLVFQHYLHDQCLPQGKEKFLLEGPLSQKGSCWRPRPLAWNPLARNRTKRIQRCDNQKNELQLPHYIVTSESIEPYDNDLELNAVAHAFSKIFQPEVCWNVTSKLKQFLWRLWTPFLRQFLPQRWTGKPKKALSLLWKISLSSGSRTNTKTFMECETKYTRSTTKQDFPGEVQLKQNIEP